MKMIELTFFNNERFPFNISLSYFWLNKTDINVCEKIRCHLQSHLHQLTFQGNEKENDNE